MRYRDRMRGGGAEAPGAVEEIKPGLKPRANRSKGRFSRRFGRLVELGSRRNDVSDRDAGQPVRNSTQIARSLNYRIVVDQARAPFQPGVVRDLHDFGEDQNRLRDGRLNSYLG